MHRDLSVHETQLKTHKSIVNSMKNPPPDWCLFFAACWMDESKKWAHLPIHTRLCVYVSVSMLNNSWAMLCTPKQRLVTEIPLHTSSDSIYLHGYKHTRRHPQRQIYLTRVGVETGFTGTGSCKLSHPWSILYRSLKINIYSAPRFVLESHHIASPGSP